MPIDKSILLEAANLIRNATRNGENTPERVGKLFVDIIEALYGGSGSDQYLSRTRDDRSIGQVSSDKAFEVGHFVAGSAGGILMQREDGKSYAEVDDLFVRRNAVFESLLVKEAKAVGGCLYITDGDGIKCTSVEETPDSYLCYFISQNSEGEESESLMITDDLALCRRGLKAHVGQNGRVETKYYWRRVLSVVQNAYTNQVSGCKYGYVELSKTDCDTGSGIPSAGDEIVHLGYKGMDDANAYRQTAIVISAVGVNAPYIISYDGIDDYSLAGKEVTIQERDAQTGKIHVRLGAYGAAHYLDYSQATGLDVAGRIHIKSTLGDSGATIGDTVLMSDVLFCSHTSASETPTLPVINEQGEIADYKGWTTNAPAQENGKFIWQCSYERKADCSARISTPICISGADGRGIASVEEQYTKYPSRTSLPGTIEWYSKPDALYPVESGWYVWTRTVVHYTSGEPLHQYMPPVCVQGEKGEPGEPGAPGVGTYRIDLSNEMAMIACNADGEVTGVYPTCIVTVWQGAEKIKPAGISLRGNDIATAWLDKESGEFRTSEITADSATVDVIAELADGNILMATMSIAKAKPCKPGDKGDKGDRGEDGSNGIDGANGEDAVIYELIPSVNAVTRNSEGELSASTVSCTVYKIVGSLRSLSHDHKVRYRRMPSTQWLTLSKSSVTGAYASVAVTSDTGSLQFELYDTINGAEIVYDRETVPVLLDASGFMGGENLLLGTNRGTYGWSTDVYTGTSTDPTPMLLSAMKSAPFGVICNNDNQYPYGADLTATPAETVPSQVLYRMLFNLDADFELKANQAYTLSFDMTVNSKGLIAMQVLALTKLGETSTNLSGGWAWTSSDAGVKTVRMEIPVKLSSRLAGEKYLMFEFIQQETNVAQGSGYKGAFYQAQISNLKLEKGSLATPWTAAPCESNYLMDALGQDTTIEGGLILSTLIRLGFVDSNGVWRVGAGINGMLAPNVDESVRSGLIMLWSGGDQIDASISESDDAATFLVRRDGSAYFCKNLIRFLQGRMEMGDHLFVDKDGLFLRNSEGELYFKLTNQSVGDEASLLEYSSSSFDTKTSNERFSVNIHEAEINSSAFQVSLDPGLYLCDVNNKTFKTISLNGGSAISAHGANLQAIVSVSVDISEYADQAVKIKFVLWLEKQIGTNWVSQKSWNFYLTRSGFDTNTITASLDGGYKYRLVLKPLDHLLKTSYSFKSTHGTFKITNSKLVQGSNTTTLMGNDGFASAWPKATLLMAKEGKIVAEVNGVGIRIVNDGDTNARLQLRNGSNYYNFNFAAAVSAGILTT